MRRLLVAVVGLTALALLGSGAPQRTYAGVTNATWVVDDGGLDCTTPSEGDGSSFTTIEQALAIDGPGDIIFVCAGVYAEPTLFMNQPNVQLLGPGYTPEDDGVALWKKSMTSASAMLGTRANGVVLSGFEFDATPPPGHSGLTQAIEGYGNDIVISNNVVKHTTTFLAAAIDIYDQANPIGLPDGTQIIGNQLTELTGSHDITCQCTNAFIAGNVMTATASFGIEVNGDGATVSDNTGTNAGMRIYSNSALVTGNNISNAVVEFVSNGGVFVENTLENRDFDFLMSAAGSPLTISTNAFRNAEGGIFVHQPNATPQTSVTIVKNTFENVLQGVSLLDPNPGDADLTAAVIGGSVANANTFTGAGGTLADNNYLVSLSSSDTPVDAQFNNWGLCTLAQIEQEVHHKPDDPSLGLVDYDPFIDPGGCPTPSPTPSPTPTASPTPSPSPTASPTATPGQLAFGDVNCDGDPNARDALDLFSNEASIASVCPDIGSTVEIDGAQRPWGDLDCDGHANLGDAMALLRDEAGLGYEVIGTPCPAIGDLVTLG